MVTSVYTAERLSWVISSGEARSNSTLKNRILPRIRAIKGLMKKRQFTRISKQRRTIREP